MKPEMYVTENNLQSKAEDWLIELERYCSAKKRFSFELRTSALLVIDTQRFFWEEDSHAFIPASKAITPNISRLLSVFRQSALPVIFTQYYFSGNEEPGIMGRWWGDVLRESNPLSEITPELQPMSSELVIKKPKYSAFKDTNLENFLKDRGVKSVVITGVLTHLCCETTARDAFMNDLEVYFVIDGTASKTEELHQSAIRTLADGFAVPVITNKIIEMLGDVR